jgi:hypothetical protein
LRSRARGATVAAMKRAIYAAVIAATATASAGTDPAIARLERALPRGWSLLATDTELVIRHDRPVYAEGRHLANEPPDSPPTGIAGGPLVTLELRYRLEPKWPAAQLAAARAANAKIYDARKALATQYRIDELRDRKSAEPVAKTADEQKRIDAYRAAAGKLEAALVQLPRCTLGASSLFDGPDTYAQLSLVVDPAQAMKEAYAIVEVVKKQCSGA